MVRSAMTRRKRILMYGAIAFVIAVILIVTTAYSQGADPFHPRTRHIWALSLIAALYASFRGAHLVDRMLRSQGGRKAMKGLGLFKSDHAIDKRMTARRERVEAAKVRDAEQADGDDDTISLDSKRGRD